MNETDRELLELAAKAAGLRLFVWGSKGAENVCLKQDDKKPGPRWNPLTDDGDALRLAVKLQLLVDTNGMHARVCFPYEAPLAYEAMGEDRHAATRRAIVRAAAEIGRAIQGAAPATGEPNANQ